MTSNILDIQSINSSGGGNSNVFSRIPLLTSNNRSNSPLCVSSNLSVPSSISSSRRENRHVTDSNDNGNSRQPKLLTSKSSNISSTNPCVQLCFEDESSTKFQLMNSKTANLNLMRLNQSKTLTQIDTKKLNNLNNIQVPTSTTICSITTRSKTKRQPTTILTQQSTSRIRTSTQTKTSKVTNIAINKSSNNQLFSSHEEKKELEHEDETDEEDDEEDELVMNTNANTRLNAIHHNSHQEDDEDDEESDDSLKAKSKIDGSSFKSSSYSTSKNITDNTKATSNATRLPNKKFRKLRLFDTPHTPKTLIRKSRPATVNQTAAVIETNTTSKPITNVSMKSIPILSNNINNTKGKTQNGLVKHPNNNLELKLANTVTTSNREMTESLPPAIKSATTKSAVLDSERLSSARIPITIKSPVSMKSKTRTPNLNHLRMRLFDNPSKSLNFDESDENDEDIIKNKSSEIGHQVQRQPMVSFSLTSTTTTMSAASSSVSSSCSINLNDSPHSPFNHLHANINPFTPTNSFDNSKLTSASNAAEMVKLALSNTPAARKQLINDQFKTNKSSSLTQLPIKRNFSVNDEMNTSSTSNGLPSNKRLALRQCLVSRYHEEFHEVCKLGSGEFGDVFKCINRLDGCTYAIKRSKKPIAGSALEVAAWKEVCAHAVLVKHNHIVQYYSAWAEADRMLIQNEYCNGGSLAEFIESLRMNNNSASFSPSPPSENNSNNSNDVTFTNSCEIIHVNNSHSSPQNPNILTMSESDLKVLLLHIAKGLAYMHSLNLVHLDIKPGNIFICRSPRRHHQADIASSSKSSNAHSGNVNINGIIINEESGIESDEIDEEDDAMVVSNTSNSKYHSLFSEVITYKIGDLGHVTSTLDPHVEEGDCRYLPNEILQEEYDQLPKADSFALALTVFVCGSLEELPKNGDEWHWIREGNLKDLPQCSERFKKLLLVGYWLILIMIKTAS